MNQNNEDAVRRMLLLPLEKSTPLPPAVVKKLEAAERLLGNRCRIREFRWEDLAIMLAMIDDNFGYQPEPKETTPKAK